MCSKADIGPKCRIVENGAGQRKTVAQFNASSLNSYVLLRIKNEGRI
jgi:hypothetical protein